MLNGYHHRGYLPHLKVEGAVYFVTFRLADSLPEAVVRRLKEQRDDPLRRATLFRGCGREATYPDLLTKYAEEVDSVLDESRGAAWLRDPQIATLVANALGRRQGTHYYLPAWCVMPNHVHAVVRPRGCVALEQILQSWKSATAHAANRLLGRSGPFWQRESYDHWIRDEERLAHFIRYTEENPVKARLCDVPSQWPWSSASR
jgi:REP element-mobilizing transposase RayT